MWGATSSRDELTGDFGGSLGSISIGDCGLFCGLAEKIVTRTLGLLQQYRLKADM
jgi:hypothetical protein